MSDLGSLLVGYGMGMATCGLAVWLCFKGWKDQEFYTDYWYRDSQKWMDAYVEATRDKADAS